MSEITKKLLENTSKPLGAPALLVLEDGAVFSGTSCAAQGEVFGEICFNTSLEGYLEVITDPSYAGQIITMTYPQICLLYTSPSQRDRSLSRMPSSA